MKKILIACLFSVVFCSGNIYSHETMTVGFHIDSLNIYDYEVNYMELDVTPGNNFFQVSGLLGFTDKTISLLSGTGYDLGNEFYLLEVRLTMDYINIQLNYNGKGNIDYYSLTNGKLSLVDSAPVTILWVK